MPLGRRFPDDILDKKGDPTTRRVGQSMDGVRQQRDRTGQERADHLEHHHRAAERERDRQLPAVCARPVSSRMFVPHKPTISLSTA